MVISILFTQTQQQLPGQEGQDTCSFIEFMDESILFDSTSIERLALKIDTRGLVIHEKTHFPSWSNVLRRRSDKNSWADISGWYINP